LTVKKPGEDYGKQNFYPCCGNNGEYEHVKSVCTECCETKCPYKPKCNKMRKENFDTDGECGPLEGCNPDTKLNVYIKNVSEIPYILNEGKYAGCADVNGAIGIWKADNGDIHVEAMRFQETLEKKVCETMIETIAWARKWIKKIK
jgi:hypothetical protein